MWYGSQHTPKITTRVIIIFTIWKHEKYLMKYIIKTENNLSYFIIKSLRYARTHESRNIRLYQKTLLSEILHLHELHIERIHCFWIITLGNHLFYMWLMTWPFQPHGLTFLASYLSDFWLTKSNIHLSYYSPVPIRRHVPIKLRNGVLIQLIDMPHIFENVQGPIKELFQ